MLHACTCCISSIPRLFQDISSILSLFQDISSIPRYMYMHMHVTVQTHAKYMDMLHNICVFTGTSFALILH